MSGAILLLLPYAFVVWTATTLPGHNSKWAFSKFNLEALHEPHYMVCTQCLICPGHIVLASAIWIKIIKSPHTRHTVFHLRNYSTDLYEIWYMGTYILNIARKRFESPGDIVHPPLKVTATALTHSIVPLPSGRWKFCAYWQLCNEL